MAGPAIEDLFREGRSFPPPDAFTARANVADPAIYEQAEADWQGWWASQAERLRWFSPWDRILE